MHAFMVLIAAAAALRPAPPPPASAWRAQPPRTGVYLCLDKSSIAQRLRMFALLDGTTYADDYGQQGLYAYDPGRGVLTGVTGPLSGVAYQRNGPQSFTLLGIDGPTTVVCPLDPKKDPRRHDW
jgi:hypothetical protein